MAIIVKWDDPEHTIIRVTFPLEWTWEELTKIDTQTKVLLDEVNHPVCYLVDMRDASMIPSGLSLEGVRHVVDFRHRNSDMLVLVGMSPLILKFFLTLLQALGTTDLHYKIAQTVDQAYSLITYRMLELERSRL